MAKLPRIITRTLSFRLSLTVIAALATLLLVALLIIFVFSRKAVKEEALQDAGQTLEATMQRIDNILLKVEQSSGNIYWKMLSHIHQPEKLELYTRKLVETTPYITDCTITWDTDSNATDSIFTGWINPEEKNANAITTFRLPVFDGRRKVGVMDVDVSLALVSKLVLDVKPSPNSFCTLLKNDGTIIVHPDSVALNKNILELTKDDHPSMTEAAQAMLNGETGYKYVKLDGEDYYVFYKPFERAEVMGRAMSKLGWSAGIIYPEDDIFGDYNRLLYYVLAIAVVGLILILVFSTIIIHRQLAPLQLLTESARRIAKGNYNETIPDSQQQDEIGELQDHFKQMQQSLATNVGELEQLTTTLKERGKGLHAAYEQAKKADQMKTAFLHNMTDQMLNPVDAIDRDTNILCDFSQNKDKEEADRLTEDVRQQCKIITELLNSLLRMSEEETGKEVAHE